MAINILLNSKSKVLLLMLYVHHRLTVALSALSSLETHARRLLLVPFKSMLTSIHVSLILVDWDSLPLGQKESCTLERTEVTTGLGFKGKECKKNDFSVFGDVSAEAVKMKTATIQALAVCQAEPGLVCALCSSFLSQP